MLLMRQEVPLPPDVGALFGAAAAFVGADTTVLLVCFVLLSAMGSSVDFSARTGAFVPLVVLIVFLFSTFDAAFFSGAALIGAVN